MQAAGARGEVALSLSDDAELRKLNLEYAGEDHATDVLSFSQTEGAGPRSPMLGDIIISVPYARRQAKGALVDELVHLAVHGLAHLLGFDHRTPAEERVMFGYEARLREAARARGQVKRVRNPLRRSA
jgi:probable rRNA maturation factor